MKTVLIAALLWTTAVPAMADDPGAAARAAEAEQNFLHPKYVNRPQDACPAGLEANFINDPGNNSSQKYVIQSMFNLHPVSMNVFPKARPGDKEKNIWACGGYARIMFPKTGRSTYRQFVAQTSPDGSIMVYWPQE